MVRTQPAGVMYAISAKAKLPLKQVTGMKHLFASYFSDDPFEWKSFRNIHYIVILTREHKNIISLTLYLEHKHTMKSAELQKIARTILQGTAFPKECGATIVHIGKPKLFLRPQYPGRADERTKGHSQKLLL